MNITSKSDVGTYQYGTHPHGVVTVTGTLGGVVAPGYHYDANGNMDCVYASSYPTGCVGTNASRKITYNSFNKVYQIIQGSRTISLYYDPEYRLDQKYGDVEVGLGYMNDPYSAARTEYDSGATGTWCDYILVPENGPVPAEETIKSCTHAGTPTVNYFTHDHLGSVAVITDQSGAVVTNGRLSYDPWGKRRNLNGSDDPTCAIASPTSRGFTGHEQIDSECLVNANARMYDAALGRFLSADTIIPDPYDGQSFNRYAYVLNGPLTYTDPTGHAEFCYTPTVSPMPDLPGEPMETVKATGNAPEKCVPIPEPGGGGSGGGNGNGGSGNCDGLCPTETVIITGKKGDPKKLPKNPQIVLIGLWTSFDARNIYPGPYGGGDGGDPNNGTGKCDAGGVAAAKMIYDFGGSTAKAGGSLLTVSAMTGVLAYGAARSGNEGTALRLGYGTAVAQQLGLQYSEAGGGLQIGAGMYIYDQTGNPGPLVSSWGSWAIGLVAPLPKMISDPASGALQDAIDRITDHYGKPTC